MLLPFAPGITGYCIKYNNELLLGLLSLRNFDFRTFLTKDQTVINTINAGFSPILEDYLGDNLPGFSDTFMQMQSCPIPAPGEEREFNLTDNIKMKFCWIPAGKAMLGSPESEEGRFQDEEEHEFETNGFWMGKYPVTQSQWMKIMNNNPSYFNGDNLPVETVSWNDCQKFMNACNVLGAKGKLPNEDQWEYACRGGEGNKKPFYWGYMLNGDKANCFGEDPYGTNTTRRPLRKTTEVGSYEKEAPHPWGLCDMSGNVWEWCENSYNEENRFQILRGGCWSSPAMYCRSSYRIPYIKSYNDFTIGFRLIVC